MFKKLNVGSKITILIFVVVLFSITAISFVALNITKSSIFEQNIANLNLEADLLQVKIDAEYKSAFDFNSAFLSSDYLTRLLSNLNENLENEGLRSTIRDSLDNLSKNEHEIILLDRANKAIFSSIRSEFSPLDSNALMSSNQYVRKSIRKFNGEIIGTLFTKINLSEIETLIDKIESDSKSKRIIIGRKSDNRILFVVNSTLESTSTRNFTLIGSSNNVPLQRSIDKKNGTDIVHLDQEGQFISTWRYLPISEWGISISIEKSEVYSRSKDDLIKLAFFGILLLIGSALVSLIFSKYLTRPISLLKDNIKLLSIGVLPENIPITSNDEFGEMAETTLGFVTALRRTVSFAEDIGQGSHNTIFEPLSDQDSLGNALINMRDGIKKGNIKDRERNWIINGVAVLGEILRSHDDLERMGDAITAFVSEKINAIQCAFYVVNDSDTANKTIEMRASYAYNKKKHLKKSFKFAEGLIGQAAVEKDIILRTEIPRDYISITSGILGDQHPTCLLLIPLITNEQVYGVIECTSFHKFDESQIKFAKEISEIIAQTIFNMKVNERTRSHLIQSQKMSNELQEKQEFLRQNAVEMQETQAELLTSNTNLELQIEEVRFAQQRTEALLANASEVITIYDAEGIVTYISPSVERIFGYKPEEIIGTHDSSRIKKDDLPKLATLFKSLTSNPKKTVTVQLDYLTNSGEYVTIEGTGSNLIDDPAIQGIVTNSQDITERLRAEKEERMRSRMQALSENSLDLITRFNQNGEFFYINPAIERYTNKTSDKYLKKEIDKVDLPSNIVKEWQTILEQVFAKNEKISKEIDFPSKLGDRVMQVNAIPEYSETEDLESVLVVSHDITERKLIERDIQTKNKKINDSINYARRIQGAILPNTDIIQNVLPESFILYKAKDVVSGDFPWFTQMGDNVFVAVVDCTGHGVPGALISLIGYFLLNDIVKSQKETDPGKILDQLDAGVTKTLRQDAKDSKTKDGMDIALCKINIKNGKVEFSGAHRSLYIVKNGELEEIKGNKFPIGGGLYKNQTNFQTHKLSCRKNDSIYFCSDGFPDQFGGPENRKFGPRRLRELIVTNHSKPAVEIGQILGNSWDSWKSDFKQTDDMLLIGVKF